MSILNIYKASAGAGKTFALTMEYFRIIFAVPAEYKNILAVTFTNKATEEMKSRIINELHKLAEGQKSDYGVILKSEFSFTDEQLRSKAGMLRTMLLHDYGRLAVTTIDRFFQRIVKSFTKELGIFPGYNVELDSDFVLMKAIDKVMQQVKNDPALRAWISELMSNSVDEGKSWSVKSKIADLGEELFKENYMLFDKNILGKFSDKNFLKDYQSFLNRTITEYEEKLAGIVEKALVQIRQAGLELSDFKGNKAGCAAYFYKLDAGNYDAPTSTTRKGVDNSDGWFTKTSVNRGKIEALFPELNLLLKEAIEVYDTQNCYYSSARHLSGNLYQLGILNDLYKEVREYCNEKGLMLLSDTTHILNILIDGNDTSFLYEKTGNYFKHLMIDEFQDTSAMQWKNFRPLVVNSLSEGNRAMIVGDVKQSIYRWRNGDWTLLANGVEQEFQRLGVENIVLENNWRSAPEIVNFNNLFFKKATAVLRALYDLDAGEDNTSSQVITEAYSALEQIPKSKSQGYVNVSFETGKAGEEGDNAIIAKVVSTINDIIERGGCLRDIVILVREGKEGAFVANYLMEYNKKAAKPLNFISNDSLYVRSSAYVQFIVAILKYIAEPYDMVNKATILYFYKIFVEEQHNELLHELLKGIREEDLFLYLNTGFAVNSGKIMSYSLYETIETIIDRFSLKERLEEVPYLIAFQDIIFEYETNNSNSITLFLEWWEKEQRKKVLSTSEDVDAVRILTIHKSKGLEFEHVILPFCSWELDSVRPARCIWCSNNVQGFNQLEYAPLNYSSKLADTIFRDDYFEEHLKAYVDNLNLLYVALTRAKLELYVLPYAPKLNKDNSISLSDIGAFIYYVFTCLADNGDKSLVFDDSMNLQIGEKRPCSTKKDIANKSLSLKSYPICELEDRVSVKFRFQDYTEPDMAGLSAVDEGKLLHEIFRTIEYSEDVCAAVKQASFSGLIPVNACAEYEAKIMEYITSDLSSEWFEPSVRVINERDILFPAGIKVRPDRVIQNGDNVCVIDYKFGQSEETKYLKQVRFYCDTLKKMGYKNVEGYIWYVKLRKKIAVC